MKHTLSIAMCTHNGARFLQEQLQSIEQQTRRPDEMVVFDDLSTDSTLTIVESFRDRVCFPVHLRSNHSRLGSTKSFEAAISECKGDIIVLADQDDFWAAHKLERLEREFLHSPDVGCVFSDAEITDQCLAPLGYRLWEHVRFGIADRQAFRQGDGFRILLRRNVVTGATLSFRAALRHAVLPIPLNWVHDAWIGAVGASLYPIMAVDEPLVKYRQHGGNQIGAVRETLAEAARRSLSSDLSVEIAKAEELVARLQRVLPEPNRSVPIRQTLAKVAHLRKRMSLREDLVTGIIDACLEVTNGGYRSYSNGLRSFMSDLWR